MLETQIYYGMDDSAANLITPSRIQFKHALITNIINKDTTPNDKDIIIYMIYIDNT